VGAAGAPACLFAIRVMAASVAYKLGDLWFQDVVEVHVLATEAMSTLSLARFKNFFGSQTRNFTPARVTLSDATHTHCFTAHP